MRSGHHFEIDSMQSGKKPLHPLWIGIGLILMAAFLGLGYLLANAFILANQSAHWVYLPAELAWPPQAPYIFLKLSFAGLFLLLGTAAITVVYGIVNPRRPGKYDVTDPSIFPPPPRSRKR